MPDQLSLFVRAPTSVDVPSDLPACMQEILQAARAISFSTRIVRGHWGIGFPARGRRWALQGDCCCALGAWLVSKGAEAEKGDQSPVPTVARILSVDQLRVREFVDGFDGKTGDSVWFGYGQRVAQELGVK
jgi:hypothetical protein